MDVTSAEMRKFFAIFFLMGHTRRDNLKEYWSTDPFLEIPIFCKDIPLQSRRDTRVVNMISTIHNSSMVDVQRRHGQVKKPVCISKYMFMKGVDRADQYLAYYSLPRKTVKWTKKVALWLIKCAILNSFLVFKSLNPHSELKYKAFLLNVTKAWATDHTVAADTVFSVTGPVYSHPTHASF
ncbi:hypothetical protein B7P43_G05174 [Cryptotermes secundus]|uniref:PiggyBac transposable element-derived protein domain-containing protein n=1 Tax=Cryptotermes secundus TaxID=105785 RepID=A0A2J7RDX4_9NEOP|nr:hypothetical protein B7P43_G05174 [Cryptotermes secundus]